MTAISESTPEHQSGHEDIAKDAWPLTWRRAMTTALFGPDGFYRRPEGPPGHFRTSATASPVFASLLADVLAEVDRALDSPPVLDFVDMGAGRGHLLLALLQAVPAELGSRLRLTGVDIAGRPAELPEQVHWNSELPADVTGLVVANEWLDTVPVDVASLLKDSVVLQNVYPDGREVPGELASPADLAWLALWWPLPPADRAEVGHPRDAAWADLLRHVRQGLVIAVDYSVPEDVHDGTHAGGTLTAYRHGRVVKPEPDGTCDITAAVLMESCATAGQQAIGKLAGGTVLTTQRSALRAIREAWPLRMAVAHPGDATAVLARLQRAGETAELTDPAGLGGFSWLVQAIGMQLPAPWDNLETAVRSVSPLSDEDVRAGGRPTKQ